ncbi:MAG: pilin N-terminal domain-containing protein [Acutalibacteraceae bacterium]
MKSKKLAVVFAILMSCFLMLSTSTSALETVTELPTDPITEATEAATTDTEPHISVSVLDKTKPVTLNIVAEDAQYNKISGVGYSLYYFSDDLAAVPNADEIDISKLTKTDMPLTDADGKSTVTLPKQGVYVVSCTTVPSNVAEVSKNFAIALPYTSDDGTQWLYTLDASPKLTLAQPTQPPTEPPTQPGTTDTTGTGSGMNTTGNGNGIATSGVKSTVNTGNVAACICLPIAILFLSVGIVFLIKTKKFQTTN